MRTLKLLKWWQIAFAIIFITVSIIGQCVFGSQCSNNLILNIIVAVILVFPVYYKITDKTRRSVTCSTDVIKLVIILSNIVLNITYYIGVV